MYSCTMAVLLSWTLAAAGDEPTSSSAIRKVLDDQVAAWNRGDLPEFMTGYWKSPELTFYSGKSDLKGWQTTLERYRKKYQDGGQSMGKLSFSGLNVQRLGVDHAFVRGRWQVVLPTETIGGLFTLIFEKKNEGWRIIHDHTSS